MEKQELKISTDLGGEIIIRIQELLVRLDEIIRIKNEKKLKDPLLDRN